MTGRVDRVVLGIGIAGVLAVVIALRRWGRVRLGRDDEEPEFTTLA